MTRPARAADPALDDMRRRARRRLVGAVVLALAAAVVVPMLLENEPRPLGEDVSVRIPPVDEGKFVNRLNSPPGKAAEAKPGDAKSEPRAPEQKSAEPRPSASGTVTTLGASAPPAADTSATRRSVGEAEQRVLAPSPRPAVPSTAPAADAAKPASEAPKPAPATASGSGAEPKAPAGGSEAGTTGATKAADAARPAEAPKAAESKPADAKVADATAASSRAAPAEAKASEAPKAGAYAVQLAAFADDKGANALAAKLKKAGYPAYTEPYTTSRGTLWRVRVGPYPNRDAAGAARDKLKAAGQNGIVAPAK